MKAPGGLRFPNRAERAEAPALTIFIGPKFIASVVAFLCMENAAMITGQDINVRARAVLY